jgi:adenine-specific DNA-methyltransferase
MRYIGSKVTLVEEIYKIVSEYLSSGSFCDPFGGTATVGSFFKEKGFKVYTGDILTFAHYFQVSRVGFSRKPAFVKLKKHLQVKSSPEIIDYLNQLQSRSGWFVQNYAIKRKFFTVDNAKKIEAIWYRIQALEKQGIINTNEKAFLLASLINSMDKVANTAGTYYAYLKAFYRKAKVPFNFSFIEPVKGVHKGYSKLGDAITLLKERKYDVIYLDPPYNSRKYEQYYHLPETIASCRKRAIIGKSGIGKARTADVISSFYNGQSALNSLKDILANAKFRLLIFHYTDDGLITPAQLKRLFKRYNLTSEYYFDSLGYTTQSTKRKYRNHIYILKNGRSSSRLE